MDTIILALVLSFMIDRKDNKIGKILDQGRT